MYGIRWIVIDEKLDLAAWRKPRLDRLNQLFASAGFSFTTSSEVTVKNPVFTDPKAEGTFSLESLTEMTAQLLGIEATSPQQVLDVLKQRLQDTGVTDNAIEQLTLDKALNGSQYLMTIARADPIISKLPSLNG